MFICNCKTGVNCGFLLLPPGVTTPAPHHSMDPVAMVTSTVIIVIAVAALCLLGIYCWRRNLRQRQQARQRLRDLETYPGTVMEVNGELQTRRGSLDMLHNVSDRKAGVGDHLAAIPEVKEPGPYEAPVPSAYVIPVPEAARKRMSELSAQSGTGSEGTGERVKPMTGEVWVEAIQTGSEQIRSSTDSSSTPVVSKDSVGLDGPETVTGNSSIPEPQSPLQALPAAKPIPPPKPVSGTAFANNDTYDIVTFPLSRQSNATSAHARSSISSDSTYVLPGSNRSSDTSYISTSRRVLVTSGSVESADIPEYLYLPNSHPRPPPVEEGPADDGVAHTEARVHAYENVAFGEETPAISPGSASQTTEPIYERVT